MEIEYQLDEHKIGTLCVWWVPQVPMEAFEVIVESVEFGVKLLDVLADYDLFQYNNNIKPDYCNVGGLKVWVADSDGEGNPGWNDWHDEETDEENPNVYLEEKTNETRTGS